MTLLEVCVDSVEGLLRAQTAGAQRIELCERLDIGGISPSAELLALALASARVPVHVMVRPRGGDFVYSAAEIASMQADIERLKATSVAGVVLGVLRDDRAIDVEATGELARLARPMRVTFHRAFDDVPDRTAALEQLIELDVDRVLTSGGALSAHSGRFELAKLVERARGRIIVLAGGGVREHDWRELVRDAGVDEIHSSTPFAT